MSKRFPLRIDILENMISDGIMVRVRSGPIVMAHGIATGPSWEDETLRAALRDLRDHLRAL